MARIHGGADAQGSPRWDFSTCANAAGPCPQALAAVRAADPTRYPDPHATAVRQELARLHGVEPRRVLPAASASEFIQRITAVSGRLWPGAVSVPAHAYGDYAAAAAAWGRPLTGDDKIATLCWRADPTSPLGQDGDAGGRDAARPTVLDAVYAPLRLEGACAWRVEALDAVFVLHSPNKALGLTGVRGAYAVAPLAAAYDSEALCQALEAAAPSWPLSAQSEAMLLSWSTPAAQAWVAHSLGTLAAWKSDLQRRLMERGFSLRPSVTPFFVTRPPQPLDFSSLRAEGLAVRDTASFGLPGCWRVSALPPRAQQALMRGIDAAHRCAA